MIIVVGARTAGACTAALLAKQGETVWLLDRNKSLAKSNTVSVFGPDTMRVFDKFGYGADLDMRGFPRITYVSHEMAPRIRIEGEMPRICGRNWCYGIRREILDQALLDYVRSQLRVNILMGFLVTDIEIEPDGVIVHGVVSNRLERIRGQLVIGADGVNSKVARLVSADVYDHRASRTCFLYCHFQKVARYKDTHSFVSYQLMVAKSRCHGFTIDSDSELTSVGIEAPKKMLPYFINNPNAFDQCLGTNHLLATRLRHAVRKTKVVVRNTPDMCRRKPFGERWALVGDAGMFMDPITGQGFNNAARSAECVTDQILAWRRGMDWSSALKMYQTTRDSESRSNYERAWEASDLETEPSAKEIQFLQATLTDRNKFERLFSVLTNALPPESLDA